MPQRDTLFHPEEPCGKRPITGLDRRAVHESEQRRRKKPTIETIRKMETFFRRVDADDPTAVEELGRYHIMNTLQPLASWQNIGKLLLREWFQRIWIMQEVVAGSQVSMICDQHKLRWETFAYVMTKIEQRGLHDLLKQENTVPPGLLNPVLIQKLPVIRYQKQGPLVCRCC